MTSCEMKGVAFFSFFDALRELRGAAAEEKTRAALPTALADALRLGGITRVGWYPMSDYDALHVAAQTACGGGEAFAKEIGYTSTDIDTRGLLKFILSFTSTNLAFRHSDKIFGAYMRGGRLVATKVEGANRYDLRFERVHGASRLVFAEWEGGVQLLAERTGTEHAVVRRESMDEPGGSVLLSLSW